MRKLVVGLAALSVLVAVGVGSVGPAGAGGENGSDGWLLGGTAQLAQDPENPANDVIKIDTRGCDPITGAGCTFGSVSRKVNTKIDKLDNMLEFKSWFSDGGLSPKSCIGGSPRMQLAVDTDGNGLPDGNAFAYFGDSPDFAACTMETWIYEDLTGGGNLSEGALAPSPPQLTPPNEELEVDLTQFGGAFYNTWSEAEDFFATGFPNHLVCTVALVDDTFGAPTMSGIAYYDIISGGRATFEDRFDVAGRGFARGCGRPDDADGNGKNGDKDKDGDVDNDDPKFDKDRRARVH